MRSGTNHNGSVEPESHAPVPGEGNEGGILRPISTLVPSILPSTPGSPTERQLQIRRHAEAVVTRINGMFAQENTDTSLLAQYKNLSAELRWWVNQYESDWAIGLADGPPPMYVDSDLGSLGPPAYPSESDASEMGKQSQI